VAAVETEGLLSTTTTDVTVIQTVRVEVTTIAVGSRPRVLNVAVGVMVRERRRPWHSTALRVTVRPLSNPTDNAA